MAAPREVNVELLIGKRVRDPSGEEVGRIEELCAERRDGELVVVEYQTGSYGLLHRLSDATDRSVFRIFTLAAELLHPRRERGYRIPWDEMDLSDPERPRSRRPKRELRGRK